MSLNNPHQTTPIEQILSQDISPEVPPTPPTPITPPTPPTPVSPTPPTPPTPTPTFEEEEEIIDEGIGEKKNPVITIFGKEYDRDSTIVMLTIIFIWGIIWKISGLWKTLKYDISFTIIFFLFAFYLLLSIKTSGKTSGGVVYELNILLTVEQMISILFGTVVLFVLFGKNLPVHKNCRPVIFKLTMSIIIILTTASLWVNVYTSGRMFRAIRKFKQGIYNVALTLFIIIALIFIKGSDCQEPNNE